MPLALLLSVAALAQSPEPAPGPETPLPSAAAATTVPPKSRDYLMEVGFRGRYLFIPNGLLDIWYERHDQPGDTYPGRPTVRAYSLGLEFVIKDEQANGIFYAEYIAPLIDEGYWDDADREPNYDDGSYIVPEGFGIVAIGANYGYELRANKWLSFLFGAGLGVGFVTGTMYEWQPGEPEGTANANNAEQDCGPTEPAYLRAGHCEVDAELKIPPVVPLVDVNIGPRFNINDRASFRLEGGLHAALPYTGATMGIVF